MDWFLRHVEIDETTGCHLWKGRVKPDGYGHIPHYGRHSYPAHRLAYELFVGPPGDALVMHTCDVRHCVNPAHLRLGTTADNVTDMVAKGRAYRGGSKNKLTWDQVCTIRREVAEGASRIRLASRFGVSRRTIKEIETWKIWKSQIRTRRLKHAVVAES